MNQTPIEAEVRVPQFYKQEREQEIQERKLTLDNILKKLGIYEEVSLIFKL